jgi:RNA polymerase sigma-70 factor, ECF subfamily
MTTASVSAGSWTPGLDESLARRAGSGDIDAFSQLVDRHRDVAVRVAARIVGSQDAEDVAQDALLRAFHRLSSFRGDGPFRVWLLRVVHTTALNALARKRPIPVEEIEDHVPEPDPDDPATPASQLEQAERRDRLAAKITLLRPEHRAVLVLRDLEGLAYEDIAAVTDTPIGSVKGRLHRARRELAEILRNNTYDWELPRA